MLVGHTVALCVTGSIAAYKAVEVARLCVKAGAKVVPLMSASAMRFVGPMTLSGITGEAVRSDMWDPSFSGEVHVEIGARADVVAIVPATADVLARLAQGRADDLITATALCAKGPVVVAPAMHPRMWAHPATARNVEELTRLGRVKFVGPVDGPVASGESGVGRMEDPAAIVSALGRALIARDLTGRRIVVTAGPTYEAIDPVRFVGNRSSGKMGFAVAARAAARGATVHLVTGPVSLATPPGVSRHDVGSADEMGAAIDSVLGADLTGADALVMAAAVADFKPANFSATKIKKNGGPPPPIALAANADLIAAIGDRRKGKSPVLVAFALETGTDAEILAYAGEKRKAKKVDVVVANAASASLGRDDNRIAIVSDRVEPFTSGTKDVLADLILDRVAERLPAV